jgi:hypothetical protein
MSFGILRTNVGLTTNVRIVIGSDYKMSLDSIDSNPRLSSDRFKNFKFNEFSKYDEVLPLFYKDVPSEIAFDVLNDTDLHQMSENFANQYDNLYHWGCRSVINKEDYLEEYEYFAPVYLNCGIFKWFIIFRVDGPGITSIDRLNFKSEIVDKLKVVKLFDLTPNTNVGRWLDVNFFNNPSFPSAPLDISFKRLEFSNWNGIDYKVGGYGTRSLFMESVFSDECELFELEKFVFNKYKQNEIVFPNILNLSFLFNDEPSDDDGVRNWSVNRYYGFYLNDMVLSYSLSPHAPYPLREDAVVIEGNLLFSESNPENPFVDDWDFDFPRYVEFRGEHFKVERYSEIIGDKIDRNKFNDFDAEEYVPVVVNFYKIISEINLEGRGSELNKSTIYIEDSVIKRQNSELFEIPDWDLADVWVIQIGDIFSKLIKEGDQIKIFSDYKFSSDIERSEYSYIIGTRTVTVSTVVDFENEPIRFNIFKLNFTDIKDFDTRITDTEFSKFEYEKVDEITETDESKFWMENPISITNPKDIDEFIYKDKVVNIPVASEYVANYEAFKIFNNGDLSDLWNINPIYSRWSFKNSLSSNDYPYVLNNSSQFENFNRTVNVFREIPIRADRNLDYFYTFNAVGGDYSHHSLHIEKYLDDDIIIDTEFEEQRYINIDSDYFSYLFEGRYNFSNSKIKSNRKKYSKFNNGSSAVPNITLFRGIEFRLFAVDSIILNELGSISNENLSTTQEFDCYKFSILLSAGDNGMVWDIIDNWKFGGDYASGSIVHFDGMLFTNSFVEDCPSDDMDDPETFMKEIKIRPECITDGQSASEFVRRAPYNMSNWSYFEDAGAILWNPTKSYSVGEYVFNSDEYYYKTDKNRPDFWNPITAQAGIGYNEGDIVLYKNKYWRSLRNSNVHPPNEIKINGINYWIVVNDPDEKMWERIPLWSPLQSYSTGNLVVHRRTIWSATESISIGTEPGVSDSWVREYGIYPDSDFVYGPNVNQTIFMNGRYYRLRENPFANTLDNGIVVYINKKWKNVLINIVFNDNTLPNLSNANRDSLYDSLYTKLVANNFKYAIDNLDKKSDFDNYVRYVIVEEDGTVNRYSFLNNFQNLPYMIKTFNPDRISVRQSAINKKSINTTISASVKLNNNKIDNIEKLNWWNGMPISFSIEKNRIEDKALINYSRFIANNAAIYKYSGEYEPLFYDIELFDKNWDNIEVGNYKFDTSLNNFGLIIERKVKKINNSGSQLKLKNSVQKSAFPMVGEFGLTTINQMIFKSNWDLKFHIETKNR